MKNKSLLAIAILSSLFVVGKLVPVKAAPNSKNSKENSEKKLGDTKLLEDTPLFESKKFRIAFITTLSMTGLAVLIGTGKSIKYNNSLAEEEANSALAEASKQSSDRQEKNVREPKLNVNNQLESNKTEEVEGFVREDNSLNQDRQKVSEELTTDYKQIYKNLQEQVYQSPHFANNPTWEIDGWEVDLEIAIMILSRYPDNFDRVEKVLLESDRITDWKKSLPQEECRTKTSEYIDKAYNWAQDLQKWRTEKAKEQQLSSK